MKKGPQINGNKTSSNVIRGLVRDHAMVKLSNKFSIS